MKIGRKEWRGGRSHGMHAYRGFRKKSIKTANKGFSITRVVKSAIGVLKGVDGSEVSLARERGEK